jgi:Mg2+/Co2+ transporter CorB
MDFELTISLVAIAALLGLSAFFSAAESGLTTASRPRMHHLENRGNRRAAVVNRLRLSKDRLIGSILLTNNLINIAAAAIATSILISRFGEAGVFYATVATTVLVVFVGEVLPKTYALKHPDRVALAVAPIMRAVSWLTWPIANGVQVMVDGLLKLVDRPGGRRLVSVNEEIRSSIDLHHQEGQLVKHQRDMLGSILDLAQVTVGEIMVHRRNMNMVDVGQPPAAIVRQVLASPHTRLPLWRDNPENIVGVLHVKDLLRAMSGRGFVLDRLDITAIATPPWFVPESATLTEQLNAFRSRRAHFSLVVDEYGALMGLVTLEDILEEIVGDIRDEHDRPVARLKPEADGSFIVDGTTTIRDLNRQFDWRLPDEEATTLAGLIIHEARIIPEVGQVFVFHGFKFEVLSRQRHQITRLKITPLAETAPVNGGGGTPGHRSSAA